jgi:radical SAM superfamily enzyme YgiQ (UPF0313 family)
MNILLTTLNAKYIHTSLALRYLKAYCQRDFAVDIVEYTIKDPVLQVVSDLYVRKPDVIGFSCYIWNIEQTLEIVRLLKKVLPDVTVVLGGPEVSYDTKEWMEREPDVDFIVMGEGEATFHHLLRELQGDRKFHFVFGAAYRKGGEVVVNPPRPKLDLNDIPTPHRFPEDLPDLDKRVIYFETSRGCPFSCQFCLSSIEVGVRYFDIERSKADLKYLIDNGAKLIKFVDRTFNIKRDYAMDIFRFLIENHNGCVFQFEITADIMRPEVLDFLSEHAPPGIFRFEIGVQSTNDLTNERIMRRQNFAKLSRSVTKIRESGKIAQHLDLIAGLPEENYDSFRKTFNDVFALRPEELQLGFLKLLRGTGLRRDAEKYGYVWMDKAPYEVLANNVLSFDDVVRIKRVEDVLEKYWNAHRMDRTMEFLVGRVFPSAFDFFQEFGDYWEARGWQRIGHQLEDLFVRLHEFLTHKGIAELDVAVGLMKLDYFLNHRYKPRKIWWTFEPGKSGLQELMRLFAGQAERISPELAAMRLSEKDLYKHAVAEVLPFDLAEVLSDPEGDKSGAADKPVAAAGVPDGSIPRERTGRFPGGSREEGGRRTALLVVYPPDGSGARWFAAAMEEE